MERQTGTNFQSQTHLEDEQDEEQDGDENISIASSDVYNNSGSLEMPLAVKTIWSKNFESYWANIFYETKKKATWTR